MEEGPGPLADGELPSESPTPPIRILLHDGQELVGRLLRRWQGNTTAWFYEVSVTLWADAQVGGRDLAEPADIVFSAPTSHVRPIGGVSYQGVPLERDRQALLRARTGRRLPTPPAPAPAPAPASDGEAGEWWALEKFRIAYDSTKPARCGCTGRAARCARPPQISPPPRPWPRWRGRPPTRVGCAEPPPGWRHCAAEPPTTPCRAMS
ncbi:hypothetical protein [Streptomyces ochraceiscleroticus]|uniref:hypothetical protein n=1 Tax=Streptomyces ochraceiscleroticus TaxID=47761 RepID=UPI00068EFE70|nr:hypothetical protein [Streptomyces ochraceiscleroticus]